MNTDYVVIGSIGFAQLGSGEYFEKEKIEKEVIQEIIAENEIFKIPKKFAGIASLRYKSFSHDFGTYRELCVVYIPDFFDDNEEMEDAFWNWVNEMESFDFESEEIIERCQKLYFKKNGMKVIQGGKSGEQGLKIV